MRTYPYQSSTVDHTPQAERRSRTVVVGINEDPASRQALRIAFAEAALRGGDLHALHVWRASSPWGDPDLQEADKPAGDYALKMVTQTVNEVVRERAIAGEPPVAVLTEVVEGSPWGELSKAAQGAAMLVVGQRHHSRVLGSVSQACVNHPPCTVVIVPTLAVED